MNHKLVSVRDAVGSWRRHSSPVIVGKDLLELLSSSMYTDAMTIYREYIQNAIDSVDEARRAGLLTQGDSDDVDIFIDPGKRTVRIRDYGMGISRDKFEERLTGFGVSLKRGTLARGFRGVGRLGGLGYCQELFFRTRAAGEADVIEMRWDCKRIKALLNTSDTSLTLQDIVNNSIDIRTTNSAEMPEHFFEVELRAIVRHKNDSLLNATSIYDYLSEVAPVPFSPNFKYGEEITAALCNHIALGEVKIQIHGIEGPVYRPHRNVMEVRGTVYDQFTNIEIKRLPSIDDNCGAIAWFLHHGYKGAIPIPRIRGLRLRTGNIQVGGYDLLQDSFAEMRFNSWAVGEIHTVDNRIIPNGRRDHFEQNVHFNNLINQISPFARMISTRCRQSSVLRNLLRDFERREILIQEKLDVLKQGSLGPTARKTLIREAEELLAGMRLSAARASLTDDLKKSLNAKISKLDKALTRVRHKSEPAKALAQLSAGKRKTYEQIFELIYACSANQTNAHILVERMLSKMSLSIEACNKQS